MRLTGKTAVVTGASRGIGRAIALGLADEGASLMITGTNEDLLKERVEEVKKRGVDCIYYVGDASLAETAQATIEEAKIHYGTIDILVNNAGINQRSTTLEMSIDDWQRVMDVNLNGTLYFCQAVLPLMIENRAGKIINVSSTAAKAPHRNAAPSYGASKAGVDYLTKHLALEMAPHQIYVNAICPGPIETDMSKQWTDEYRQTVLEKIPLGRIGEPKHVAETAVFLASSMSDFITGQSINVNGGTLMS
ncbi:SDR family NAD(P)-dependent oxidoreductase [Aureibacillus halotolerans]|uniref:3-oxoacyl-[acyl-carrier protein] reductase n=1 Tax=Aureibacillus halotolerans TaxID=1508390 RepID=A0A4R6UCX5_9BACI|nr:SDR family NAD(P)-dependent oxidoreductase [Aureibacillus halotolerans]TDQ42615.1 3-oxoacyl-[acyl-carrier protein] reductase [Aureibacillus halotolerans]